MYDVFISHSSNDKDSLVVELVDKLTQKGLHIWYDNYSILKGDIIKDAVIEGIHESVVFIAVITSNFFESNWASLELGVLQTMSPNNFIPLISKDIKDFASQKYPFLFSHNYIEICEPLHKVVEEINDAVTKIKHECGLWHINKTNLKSLVREMRTYNDFKLDQLAIKLSSVLNLINTSTNSSLFETKAVIDTILSDIAARENIYLSTEQDSMDLFLSIDFLSSNLKEHIKFLKQIINESLPNYNSLKNSQTDLYLMQFSLYSLIEWYMLSYFKKPTLSTKTIVPVAPEEFSKEDILKSYEIEKLVLPPTLIANPSVVLAWNEHNPLTFIGARDTATGDLVGFFNTLPISDKFYNAILSGDFDDTTIDINEIKQYDMPGFYKLYLCSFCINPAYNTTTAFKVIYNSFIDFLLNLASERDIFISDIIADGVTPKGASLCESIGMKKEVTTPHNSNVYTAKLIPPEYSTLKLNDKNGHRLISYYDRIYNEYKELF